MAWSDMRFRRMMFMSVTLGIGVGLFSASFTWLWHNLDVLIWDHARLRPVDRIWISAIGGFIIGLLLMRMHNPGSMATIVHHFHKSGNLPMRDNLPVQPVSMIGLAAGQSAGPEGALTQAGGSLGGWMARRLHHPRYQRLLTLAGMGAGFGAFLGAPVGGAVLWLELLHTRGLEYFEAIIPTVVCSCVAFLVMTLTLGHGVVQPWHVTVSGSGTWATPLIAVMLGLACGPVAKLYSLLFHQIGNLASFVRGPILLRTTIAGICIGLLGWSFPLSYFYGSKQIGELLILQISAPALLGLLLAKMLAAGLTVRGYWQGGLIIPHMFMGAVFGKLLAMWIPGLDPILSILCGMAGFNAAATQTPLSSAMIVLALTGYAFPAPVFLASVTGFLAGQGTVIIENKQPRTEPINFHHEPVESLLVP